MSSFTQSLTVTKLYKRKWMVERTFTYHIGLEDSSEQITVQRGFITDFASVPRLFWILIPPDGQYSQAAVLHDFTYYKKLYIRKRCDEIFLEAMGVLGIGRFKRYIMYYAVRMFGFIGWNTHRKRELANESD